MDIIDRINLLLSQKGLTGAELSRAIGLSNSVYSQWNTRATSPSKKNLAKVADFLGTTVEYLLGTEQKEKAPAQKGERAVTDDDIKFALWGTREIDDDVLNQVKSFAKFARENRKDK